MVTTDSSNETNPHRSRRLVSTVPFPPDPNFVDRPEIQDWLHERCTKPAARIALVGPGGIGKSQIALQYAHQVQERCPETAVLWVPASTFDRLEDIHQSLAQRLQLSTRGNPGTDIQNLVKAWLSAKNDGPWVIILDYLSEAWEDSADGLSTAQNLATLLPRSLNGSVVVTTRSKGVAEKFADDRGNIFEVGRMDNHETRQLLKNNAGSDYGEAASGELAFALQHLPLAITLAGAFIKHQSPQMPVSTYLEFRDKHLELPQHVQEDLHLFGASSIQVVTTLQIKLENIRRERPSAADLLFFMSFFNPQAIHKSVLQAYIYREGDITDDSVILVTRSPQRNVLGMHALVRNCIQTWLSNFDNIKKWKQLLLRVILRVALDHSSYSHSGSEKGFWRQDALLSTEQSYEFRRRSCNEVEELTRRLLGIDHHHEVEIMSDLAWGLEIQESHGKAGHTYGRMLGKLVWVFVGDHNTTVSSMSGFASVLHSALVLFSASAPQPQQEYDVAGKTLQRAIDASVRSGWLTGIGHPGMLMDISGLVLTLRNKTQWVKSDLPFLDVMDIIGIALGMEHTRALPSMHYLEPFRERGQWKEAQMLLMQALVEIPGIHSKEHSLILKPMAPRLNDDRNQGLWENVSKLLGVQAIRRRKLGGDRAPPGTATVSMEIMAALASTSAGEGSQSTATGPWEKLLKRRQRRFRLGNSDRELVLLGAEREFEIPKTGDGNASPLLAAFAPSTRNPTYLTGVHSLLRRDRIDRGQAADHRPSMTFFYKKARYVKRIWRAILPLPQEAARSMAETENNLLSALVHVFVYFLLFRCVFVFITRTELGFVFMLIAEFVYLFMFVFEMCIKVAKDKYTYYLARRAIRELAARPAFTDTISQSKQLLRLPDPEKADNASKGGEINDNDVYESSDQHEAKTRLLNPEAAAGFLASERPFDLDKEGRRKSWNPLQVLIDWQYKTQSDAAQGSSVISEQDFSLDVSARVTLSKRLWRSEALSWLWCWLINAYSPPLPQYQRLWYTCGCGDLSYVDVQHLSPGGINRFRQRLVESVTAVTTRLQNSHTPSQQVPPPQAHFQALANGQQLSGVPLQNFPTSPPVSLGAIASRNSRLVVSRDPQYALLCINTKSSTALAHLETTSLTSDQYLFQNMYQKYRTVRSENEWSLSLLVPSWMRKLLLGISSRLPSLPSQLTWPFSLLGLGELFRGAHLHKVTSGDFVRFQLIPIREECCPSRFKRKDLPPEAEVRAGRYEYEPVPMDDVELAEIPLSHLLKPGPHADTFWMATFPKKLREPLVRLLGADGQRVIGWGIRINEGLNWTYIMFLVLILIVAIGVMVVVYAVLTSDNSAAFGLGAILVALFTVYITYQYLTWKEEFEVK